MGNSGSVGQMQSAGLKELHNYYQAQSNDDDGAADNFSFLRGEHQHKFSDRSMPNHQTQFTRIPSSNPLTGLYPTSTSKTVSSGPLVNNNSQHIKVLPRLSENLRLRSTTNGAILHSGGTISGRRESLLPQPLERSRTFITEHSDDDCRKKNPSAKIMMMMQRRSQTQLEIDVRKRNSSSKMLNDENANHKHFSSNLDLRSMSVANANIDTYSNENYQKLSKAKIRTKKRKAPQVPPAEQLPIIDQNNEFDRRQRIFKTKTETTAINSKQQQQQPIIKQVERRRQEPSSPVMMRTKLNPGFRREKSFDAKILSSETTRKSERELRPSNDVGNKRKSLQIAKTTTISTPIIANEIEKSDFKMELEAATKFRYRSMTTVKNAKPSTFQKEPTEEKPKLPLPSREIQSKIPQLKKTFYFGMENSKRKPLTTTVATTMMTNDFKQKMSSPSALDETTITKNSSKDQSEDYSLKHKCGDSKIRNDNGIQLNVRPTLPRRQLEIPRFSPVAAWRTLSASDEQHPKEQNTATTSSSPSPSLNAAIEATNTFLIEDRIHRTYRDPCPFYPDNKSGDSGISGDDGYIVEKPIQPRNLVQVQNNSCHELANFDINYPPVMDEVLAQPMKVVGPFLTAWTPQQDLDDEDTSSDGDNGGEITLNMPDNCQSPTSPHVFSLSLPRENQLAVYGEKNKPNFRSLQKLKRTTSGDLNDINCGCTNSIEPQLLAEEEGDDVCLNNFRSDNWVLSKTTGMTAASTYLNNDPRKDYSNGPIEGPSSYFDLSASAQPMSLGSLATGKHVMYLPNRTIGSEFKRQSVPTATGVAIRPPTDNLLEDPFCNSSIPTRNKRFSFQSSVRQIERRRIAEKLSKEADQKEALRKSELEAMRRVEEEFQKKRAYEKASIRHQLRLYSMDDDNFISLPNNLNDYRAEPDGAVSSASESPPVFQTSTTTGRRNTEYPNRGNDLEIIFSNS